VALSLSRARITLNPQGIAELGGNRLSPLGRDIEGRAIRVARQMKANASARPGPEIRTSNLHDAIGVLRIGTDSQGLFADIGPQHHRMIRRGYNYALILEGVFPRGGAPPDGKYPFMADALKAIV
jgi:hypothetical protein